MKSQTIFLKPLNTLWANMSSKERERARDIWERKAKMPHKGMWAYRMKSAKQLLKIKGDKQDILLEIFDITKDDIRKLAEVNG